MDIGIHSLGGIVFDAEIQIFSDKKNWVHFSKHIRKDVRAKSRRRKGENDTFSSHGDRFGQYRGHGKHCRCGDGSIHRRAWRYLLDVVVGPVRHADQNRRLSTQIGFFIYFETAFVNVFDKKYVRYFRWLYLLPGIFFAGVANVDRLWVFANISVGVCVLPNLVALLALNGVFFTLMKDYMSGTNRYTTEATDSTQQHVREAA